MLTLLLAGWLAVAGAGKPDPVEALVEAVAQANAGDRKGAIATLDALLAHEPDLIDAHVLRGIQRHLLGDAAGARADLAWAFSTERWQRVETTSKDFQEVETETVTVDLIDQRISGAAILVVIEARAGDTKAGRDVLERARGLFGPDGRLLAAEARLLLAETQPEAAWRAIEAALSSSTSGIVTSVASELAALDPKGAPPDLVDGLAAAGQWTAVYNQGRGLLAEGRAGRCAEVVDESLPRFDEPKLLALGYSCAARSDAARAEAFLQRLGGPRAASPADVVSHARMLIAAGRVDDGLTLLADLPKKVPDEVARNRRTVQLETLLAAGRLDEAAALCDGTVPASEARIAHALVQAKRVPDARRILERACPAMGDDPGRPACDQLLAWTRSQ